MNLFSYSFYSDDRRLCSLRTFRLCSLIVTCDRLLDSFNNIVSCLLLNRSADGDIDEAGMGLSQERRARKIFTLVILTPYCAGNFDLGAGMSDFVLAFLHKMIAASHLKSKSLYRLASPTLTSSPICHILSIARVWKMIYGKK